MLGYMSKLLGKILKRVQNDNERKGMSDFSVRTLFTEFELKNIICNTYSFVRTSVSVDLTCNNYFRDSSCLVNPINTGLYNTTL